MKCLQKVQQNVSSLRVTMEISSKKKIDSNQYLVSSVEVVKKIRQISKSVVEKADRYFIKNLSKFNATNNKFPRKLLSS